MNTFTLIAVIAASVSVFGMLVLGLISMVKGGAFNEKYGNRLMRARVMLQGATLALLALVFFTSQS